jgi:O-antigen/teichoic acid export membrane protein
LALTGSERATVTPGSGLRRLWSRLVDRFGGAEHLVVQRLAGTVFLIRVFAAALAYGSQVLFARWMGSFEFGIFVYVWTWVLLIGQALDLGLATAAQRFIPEYRENGHLDRLRGFVTGSRWIAVSVAIMVALGCAGLVRLLQPWLDDFTVIPLYLACMILPAYALANVQDGISRSYDWVGLGLMPTYVARQVFLTALMAAAYFGGLRTDAATALVLAGVAIWGSTIWQMIVLNRRLEKTVEPGPKTYEPRFWLSVALPILLVEGFYLLLAHTDILILQQFRSPQEVAVYYAAAKTLALVAFIYFAISATTAHRFSAYHVAGDHAGLAAFLARAVQWTFWPSLAAAAVLLVFGRQVLGLFGAEFTAGYHLLFILSLGLLARASIGPVERLLSMLGEQRICAVIYGAAFAVNAALCFLLIPRFGAAGAAIATASALIFETILLFFVTRRRLGFHVFIWGRPSER